MDPERSQVTTEPGVGSPTKRERLLDAASELMARQGYDQTTIRDVARVTRFSLSGMYYYFKSKDDLLFQIQHRTFSVLLERQQAISDEDAAPREKLQRLVENHLHFYTEKTNEMKVCAFELESLEGEFYESVRRLRAEYFKILAGVVRDLLPAGMTEPHRERLVRHYTLFMFGMLNWIFTWFEPERDGPVAELGHEMIDLVLPGLTGGTAHGAAGPAGRKEMT